MIAIKFGICNSSLNTINKSYEFTREENIQLKHDVDIINPLILMRGDDYNLFNYAYIAELKRYYFIRDVQLVGFKLHQISLECDVLETYKEQILNSDALFNRGLKSGDLISNGLLANVTAEAIIVKGGVNIAGQSSIIMTTAGA